MTCYGPTRCFKASVMTFSFHVALLCLPSGASVQLLVLSLSNTFLLIVCFCVILLASCGKFKTEGDLESRMFGCIVEYKKLINLGGNDC